MTKFHGIVNLDDNGEVVCFCSYAEYEAGRCACRIGKDCPEAMIEISVIPGTKPSEQVTSASRELEKTIKDFEHGAKTIKQGLYELEKTLRGRKDFKF